MPGAGPIYNWASENSREHYGRGLWWTCGAAYTALLVAVLVMTTIAVTGQFAPTNVLSLYLAVPLLFVGCSVLMAAPMHIHRQKAWRNTFAQALPCSSVEVVSGEYEGLLVSVSGTAMPTETLIEPCMGSSVLFWIRLRHRHTQHQVTGERRERKAPRLRGRSTTVTAQSADGFVVLSDHSGAVAVELHGKGVKHPRQLQYWSDNPDVDDPAALVKQRYQNVVLIGDAHEVLGAIPGDALHVIGQVHSDGESTWVGPTEEGLYHVSLRPWEDTLDDVAARLTFDRWACVAAVLCLAVGCLVFSPDLTMQLKFW